jgi:Histidine kinase-, DNA gyrase B-, and HSP90-like ATPase
MPVEIQTTALARWLREDNESYYGKLLELRSEVLGWLEYIPSTFPHYTRHTVGHSDNIVLQLSKLLFRNDDRNDCILKLSGAEAYILMAAAYLHDSGMVASPKELQEILTEVDWQSWTTGEGYAADRWNEIQKLRNGDEPSDKTLRDFIADLETRYLLAEYVRRVHHERAAFVIEQHQSPLGRFAFDDFELRTAISEVCVGHGLRHQELDDTIRYPLLRQIRGEDVNLRLLAILFRLGDLLDLHSSRACPLLLNAASPLPSESLAHWDQYRRITHRAVSPEKIEIIAECVEPDEHRVLRDWCQWIVDEVNAAPRMLAGAMRHSSWHPPIAAIDGENPTIRILPSPEANYYARDWRFELDETSVFQRLIQDAYEDPNAFIRELIQNSLDAMRCQIYEDLTAQGSQIPNLPTRIKEEYRDNYILKIRIRTEEIKNDHSNKLEDRNIITIDDCGLGMDEEVITKHLLQVGKSFYSTEIFRRRYSFVPTSKFGIGFLSVFSVSDFTTLETNKASENQSSVPMRLNFTGPRNYVIVEKGSRSRPGTRIDVRLLPKVQFKAGDLTKHIRELCPKVEFPIEVDDFGAITVIKAENPSQFEFKVPDYSDENSEFELLSFPISHNEVEGEFYVFVHKDCDGIEDWTTRHWYEQEYLKLHPAATVANIPNSNRCLHGLSFDQRELHQFGTYKNARTERLDIRGPNTKVTLSRSTVRRTRDIDSQFQIDSIVDVHWEKILDKHIANRPSASEEDRWKYLQELADQFSLRTDYWNTKPGMVKVYANGKPEYWSFNDFLSTNSITEVIQVDSQKSLGGNEIKFRLSGKKEKLPKSTIKDIAVVIDRSDIHPLCDDHSRSFAAGREPENPRFLNAKFFAVDWVLSPSLERERSFALDTAFGCKFKAEHPIAIQISRIYPAPSVILINSSNELGRWILAVMPNRKKKQHHSERPQIGAFWGLFTDALKFYGKDTEALSNHIAGWNQIQDLPDDLRPPEIDINQDSFKLLYSEPSC